MTFASKSLRRRASSPQGSSSNGCSLFRKPDRPVFVPRSFPTTTIIGMVNSSIYVCYCLFVCNSPTVTAGGPQCSRLPISPTATLPSCLWSLSDLHISSLFSPTIFYRDAISALLHLVNRWFNFTSSRSRAFRYGRQNKRPAIYVCIHHVSFIFV